MAGRVKWLAGLNGWQEALKITNKNITTKTGNGHHNVETACDERDTSKRERERRENWLHSQ